MFRGKLVDGLRLPIAARAFIKCGVERFARGVDYPLPVEAEFPPFGPGIVKNARSASSLAIFRRRQQVYLELRCGYGMKGYTVMGDFSRFEEAIRRGFMLLLVTGTTDTSLIPGLTIAGASPDLTHFTPAADAEYLIFGKTKSVPGIPVTPDGKPTPAILTRSALSVIDAGALVVNAGTRVKPLVPIVELGGFSREGHKDGERDRRGDRKASSGERPRAGKEPGKALGKSDRWGVNPCRNYDGHGFPRRHGVRPLG